MVSVEETVARIVDAPSWDQRVAQIRLVNTNHGTGEHQAIYAAVAKAAYVPHLAPDFAYLHESEFYERPTFMAAYAAASTATDRFTRVGPLDIKDAITNDPRTLLVFRTILGLGKDELSHSTALVSAETGGAKITSSKIDSMEKRGTVATADQAETIAQTITKVMDGSLFGDPPGGLHTKQRKLDTAEGWYSVHRLASDGVDYGDYLHQRHFGGAFRQLLDATSSLRGDLIEDAVEGLFASNKIPYIRTGSHNQGDITARFELQVTPAPDFVVYDSSDTLRAMLECKLVSDGGTARDKALRFERLRAESVRLGGVPLLAVLGGMGWTRVNDTLGPVVRDTDGRVFTLANLDEMLEVAPFPSVIGTATV